MQRVLCFLLVFYISTLSSKPFFMLTIPKSGTHLLHKTLTLFTDEKILMLWKEPLFKKPHFFFPPKMNVSTEQFLKEYPQYRGQCIYTHLNYSHLFREFKKEHPKYAAFIMIRDLRDAFVSLAYFIAYSESMKQKPIDEKIAFLMNIDDSSMWCLQSHAKEALIWMQDPKATIIRFENLIGPNGGGTQELQDAELVKIANALSIPLDDSLLDYVRNNMWGGTWTFRKGEIGQWKTHFTPQHKALFKEKMGDLLIALGYEKDDEW